MKLGGRGTAIDSVAWGPDGQLAAGCTSGPGVDEGPFVYVWDTATGEVVTVLDESGMAVEERDWRWDIDEQGELARTRHPGQAGLAFSPKGDLYCSCFGQLLRYETGSWARKEIGEGGSPLTFSRDGRILLCGTTALWDAEKWELLPGPLDGQWEGYWITVEAAALDADGNEYAWCTATPDDKFDPCQIQVGVSDVRSGRTKEYVFTERRVRVPSALAYDTKRGVFAMDRAYWEARVRRPQAYTVWRRGEGWTKQTPGLMVDRFAITPDGLRLVATLDELVAAAAPNGEGAMELIDPQLGKLTALAIAPDGRRALVGSKGGEVAVVMLRV